MDAPHPMLRELWRPAGAPAAALRALRAAERRVLELVRAPATGALTDAEMLAPLLDPARGGDALARALTKLRQAPPPAAAAPARGAAIGGGHHHPPSPARRSAKAPAALPSRRQGLEVEGRAAAIETRPQVPPVAPPAALPLTRRFEPIIARAARRTIPDRAEQATAARAVALLLEGRRPPTVMLLAAVDDEPEPPDALPDSRLPADTDTRLALALARFAVVRRAAPATTASPVPADRRPPVAGPGADAPSSGLRRLAARFPAGGRAGFARRPEEPSRSSPAAAVPGDESPEEAAPDLAPVLQRPPGSGMGNAELADRIAALLRREARRQGIRDGGGTA